MNFRGLVVYLIFDQFLLLSKEEEFLFGFGQKYNSPLSLVLTDFEAGCLLEPLLGYLYLCLQESFEDSLLFPDLFHSQTTLLDLCDGQFEVHELFLLHCQDATLLLKSKVSYNIEGESLYVLVLLPHQILRCISGYLFPQSTTHY